MGVLISVPPPSPVDPMWHKHEVAVVVVVVVVGVVVGVVVAVVVVVVVVAVIAVVEELQH